MLSITVHALTIYGISAAHRVLTVVDVQIESPKAKKKVVENYVSFLLSHRCQRK
jgi:hypothetical protein